MDFEKWMEIDWAEVDPDEYRFGVKWDELDEQITTDVWMGRAKVIHNREHIIRPTPWPGPGRQMFVLGTPKE